MKKELIIIAILIIGINPIFAKEKYVLEIDEHAYDVMYEVNADVLAMEIDPESKSLLVGIDNTKDSEFMINFPKEMIDAENEEFAVLVNGLEVEYEISLDPTRHTLTFYVPVDAEEIEIIGTHVIPEFPIGLIGIIGVMMMISIIITRRLGSNLI